MDTIIIVMIYLTGFAVGSVFWSLIDYLRRKKSGVLHIEENDELGLPYLFLELSEKIDVLSKKKRVTFEVDDKSFLSQK